MRHMFYWCIELRSIGDISSWNVSKVTNMCSMFNHCEYFNQDLSCWDVSSVKDMEFMFKDCNSFNQDISSWDVSSVTDKSCMFYDCSIKDEYKPKF